MKAVFVKHVGCTNKNPEPLEEMSKLAPEPLAPNLTAAPPRGSAARRPSVYNVLLPPPVRLLGNVKPPV